MRAGSQDVAWVEFALFRKPGSGIVARDVGHSGGT
jgi:hypothetical protein